MRARTRTRSWLCALLLWASGGGGGPAARAEAQDNAKAKEQAAPATAVTADARAAAALLAVTDADPLELARVAARFDDDVTLSLLAPGRDPAVRLAAVRACPWLRAPERALAPLAGMARDRDPDLAPAAARAAFEIAAGLDARVLARREQLALELVPVLTQLQSLSEQIGAAEHVRRYAWAAAEQLIAAGVTPPPPEK